ncbi:hypothetical protein THRCLA_01052 [Thraustotheca clavata]|uniref:Uncharacterized protein n=1 Tax=Thraustotheca clavata TaxID=74557 RepID=A0A1W0A9K8_9STRA|nr:hypothetical protein THRCLA_01052 [Thraustotheca clavata]
MSEGEAKQKKKQWKPNEAGPGRARSRGKEKSERREIAATPPRTRNSNPKERNGVRPPMAKLTPQMLEIQLQTLLTSGKYEETAAWIQGSAYLMEKYHLADVVRLVLDQKQFDLAGRLIRDFKLAENQALVTLFIKELVRSGQFNLAVRYAQELVVGFNKGGIESPNHRPTWTPQTLIQAMIRAQQFKSALKYTKQFQLEQLFPVKQLILGLLEDRAWTDAFSAIVEQKLENEFSLDKLVDHMMDENQWSSAFKSIKAKPSVFTPRMVVQRMLLCGDFLPAIAAIKDYGFEQDEPLLKQALDSMIHFNEFYKTLKYSAKFGLSNESPYTPQELIRAAINKKQHHVAKLYIQKHKLEAAFTAELKHMEEEKVDKLLSFRAFLQQKRHQLDRSGYKLKLQHCLGPLYDPEDDFEQKEEEIILSIDEEVIPRPKKALHDEDEDDDDDDEILLQKPPTFNTFDDDDAVDSSHQFLFSKKPSSSFLHSLHTSPDTNFTSFSDSFRFDALHESPSLNGDDTSRLEAVNRAFSMPKTSFNFSSFANTIEPSKQPPLPPPLPTTVPTPPPMPLGYTGPFQPPLPPPFPMQNYYSQPPLPKQQYNVASLAMQFHGPPPAQPPLPPPLPPYAPPQRPSFVPSISLKNEERPGPPARRIFLNQIQLKGQH